MYVYVQRHAVGFYQGLDILHLPESCLFVAACDPSCTLDLGRYTVIVFLEAAETLPWLKGMVQPLRSVMLCLNAWLDIGTCMC